MQQGTETRNSTLMFWLLPLIQRLQLYLRLDLELYDNTKSLFFSLPQESGGEGGGENRE